MLKGKLIITNPPILSPIEIEIINPETWKGIKYVVSRSDIHPSSPPKFVGGKRYIVTVRRMKWKKSKQLLARPGNCVSFKMFLTKIKICVDGEQYKV